MTHPLFVSLALGAMTVGSLHSVAPDHWVPFAALTMVLLVLPARAGAHVIRAAWLDHYGDVAAGGIIAFVGLAVTGLGW